MILYLDTSAILKLANDEPGSDAARELWEGAVATFSSTLAYAEARAALAHLARSARRGRTEIGLARRAFDRRWDEVDSIGLTPDLAREAGSAAERHGLRGGDAVHLATAELLRADGVVMATWDRRLARAAADAGLRVAPDLG